MSGPADNAKDPILTTATPARLLREIAGGALEMAGLCEKHQTITQLILANDTARWAELMDQHAELFSRLIGWFNESRDRVERERGIRP